MDGVASSHLGLLSGFAARRGLRACGNPDQPPRSPALGRKDGPPRYSAQSAQLIRATRCLAALRRRHSTGRSRRCRQGAGQGFLLAAADRRRTGASGESRLGDRQAIGPGHGFSSTATALGGRANLRWVWPQPATGERFRGDPHQQRGMALSCFRSAAGTVVLPDPPTSHRCSYVARPTSTIHSQALSIG